MHLLISRGISHPDLAFIIPPQIFSASLKAFEGCLVVTDSFSIATVLDLLLLNGLLLFEFPCGLMSIGRSYRSNEQMPTAGLHFVNLDVYIHYHDNVNNLYMRFRI